jgi:RNA polymerase sigma-70 factor, ECF subfamily
VDKEFEPASSAQPAPLEQVKQTVHSDLEYVSLQVDGATYGGWYRVLADGRMELLALANVHCERRPENTPVEQARGMLSDFVRVARPRSKTNGSATANGKSSSGRPDENRAAAATLGDLLYADKGKTRVSEDDWVEIVRSIATGNLLAMRGLYERTHRAVFTLIMRLVNDRETAEELTLDVFHDIWRRASQYDAAGGSVLGWIMNEARARAIHRLRSELRNERINLAEDRAVPMNAAPMNTANGFDGASALREQSRLLRNALADLTPEERDAIETAFFSELGYAEVAARLQQPLGTVKTSVHSGLGKLRQALTSAVEL